MPELPPEQEAIARRVVELLREQPTFVGTPNLLTRTEARAYTKRPSQGGFCAWCRRWKIKPVSRGRYSRRDLDLALSREAKLMPTPATILEHQRKLGGKAA
jgi:hypothetical protein